jgi:alpha-L-rhamnosidase
MHSLSENGHAETAYRIATQTDYPSWGRWIKEGATTLYEDFDGRSSLNHIMLGDISNWFYRSLAGLNPDPAKPGFKNVIVRPRPINNLPSAKAEHRSMHGTVKVAWKKEGKSFELDVAVPANTTATVFVPTLGKAKPTVTEGKAIVVRAGKKAKDVDGVTFLRMEDDAAVLQVASGKYSFRLGAK